MRKNIYRVFAVGVLGTLLFTTPTAGMVTQAKESKQVQTVAGAGALFTDALKTENDTATVSENEVETTKEAANTIYGYENLGIAKVEGTLNVRETPAADASIVGKMPDKSAAEILETLNGWYKIQSGEVTGYVSSDYIVTGMEAKSLAEEVKQTVAKVTTTTLNVREQANTECSILALMPQGEELNVLEDLGDWVKVDLDNSEGYVSKEFVEVSVELPKAMTMTEVRYGQGVSDFFFYPW